MLRSESLKGVILSKADEAIRSPEHVEKIWDDAVDGAWAPGKAPVTLLSEFLQYVQDDDIEHAERTAQAILAVEPQNQLVQDLVAAMKQQKEMEDQLESEEESEDDEDDEDDEGDEDRDGEEHSEEDDDDGEQDEDDSPEIDRDEK